MQSPSFQSNQTANSDSRIARFLNAIDRLSDALGTSVLPIVDLEKLRSLPSGTFGRAWADSLDQHHLQPFTTGPRRKQLHDGVHILTGYGTDAIGEAEVQAFLLGAKFHLVHVILGLGLLRQVRQQSSFSHDSVKLRLQQAYWRGQRSQFDVDNWQPELMWSLSLDEVRSRVGI
jgi:ubiquinone biosynthesis protein COQ4